METTYNVQIITYKPVSPDSFFQWWQQSAAVVLQPYQGVKSAPLQSANSSKSLTVCFPSVSICSDAPLCRTSGSSDWGTEHKPPAALRGERVHWCIPFGLRRRAWHQESGPHDKGTFTVTLQVDRRHESVGASSTRFLTAADGGSASLKFHEISPVSPDPPYKRFFFSAPFLRPNSPTCRCLLPFVFLFFFSNLSAVRNELWVIASYFFPSC